LAYAYGKSGNPLKASPHIQELVRLDPNFALAYLEIKQLIERFAIIENPIRRYNKAIKILPNDPDLHFKLALHFFSADDFRQALTHFDKSMRLRPKDGRTHYYAGLINHLMGNGANAINHMKHAEESFIERKESKSIADVRKHLRVYQNQYGVPTIQNDGSSVARTIN
jgi:tetratricopeptide (TPR) repeat protein